MKAHALCSISSFISFLSLFSSLIQYGNYSYHKSRMSFVPQLESSWQIFSDNFSNS